MFHFAYGSNMEKSGMARRCPGAEPLGVAVLDGFRFRINQDGYATIVAAEAGRVHGVLWRIADADVASLDAYEGIAEGLYRKEMIRVRFALRAVDALTYVATRTGEGRARPLYQEAVVEAALSWNLPAPYLRELERWLPFASRPGRKAAP